MEKLGDLITLREASKISGYNSDYLSYLIRSGKMHGRKVGRNWMTTQEDVKYYLVHLSALSKITRKPVTFSSAIFVVFISVLATFGVYYGYTIIYQNAYDQAAKNAVGVSENVSTQLDQNVEKSLQ